MGTLERHSMPATQDVTVPPRFSGAGLSVPCHPHSPGAVTWQTHLTGEGRQWGLFKPG